MTWARVDNRRRQVLDLLRQVGCITSSDLANRLGVSHSQAYYDLAILEYRGEVVRYKTGRAHVWCASPVSSPIEAYTIISPCFKYTDRALAELIRAARGSIITITPSSIIRTIERLYRAKCDAAPLGRPHLLAAARAWLESHLDGAILYVKKREGQQTQYVIDVKKAREKLGIGQAGHAT